MKDEHIYNLIILSNGLRDNYNFRYNIFNNAQIKRELQTDSKYEVKMWMDLRGVKCIDYYVTKIGVNKFTYTIKLG